MSFLLLNSVSKITEDATILDDITFSLDRPKKLAIAGETGSGKSTLLKIIAGLAQSTSGRVMFKDQLVPGPDDRLVAGHPHIAYLSQSFELPKFLTVKQVLSYATKTDEKLATKIFKLCRIDHLISHKTNELSGGEKQRIALARVLISLPDLLLLDEPYSNLDSFHKNILKSVVDEVTHVLGITCILVSHDPVDTLSWADEILILERGRIIQAGSPKKIYYDPGNKYVAGLFGKYTMMTPSLRKLFFPDEGTVRGPVFLRPEELSIVAKSRGVSATVRKVTWCGSYFELEIVVLKSSITISTNKTNFKPGDTIEVAAKINRPRALSSSDRN